MASKVFLACALGGGVGAFVALQTWPPLWWVGMIVGGFVGYFTYEFNEVRRAASRAWRKTIEWHPNREFWSRWHEGFSFVFNTMLNQVMGICLAGAFIYALWGTHSPYNNWLLIKTAGVLLLAGASLSLFIAILSAFDSTSRMMDMGPYPLSCPNVFRFYFWSLPRGIIAGMRLVVTRGPGWISKGAVIIAEFFWNLFVLIHSEVRLLCGLDAAFGAAVGYYFGHAVIGALVGGVFGVINFEVVSKRWLKLVPAKVG